MATSPGSATPNPAWWLLLLAPVYLGGIPAFNRDLVGQFAWLLAFPAALLAAAAVDWMLRSRSYAVRLGVSGTLLTVILATAVVGAPYLFAGATPGDDRPVTVVAIASPQTAPSASASVPGNQQRALPTSTIPSRPAAPPTAMPTYRGLNIGGSGTSCVQLVSLPENFVASLLVGESSSKFAYDNFVPDPNVYHVEEYMVFSICPASAPVLEWQLLAEDEGDVIINAVVEALNTDIPFSDRCQLFSPLACSTLSTSVNEYRGKLSRRQPCDVTTSRRWQPAQRPDPSQGEVALIGRILIACVNSGGGVEYCENDPVVLGFDGETITRVDVAELPLGRSSIQECSAVIAADGLQLKTDATHSAPSALLPSSNN